MNNESNRLSFDEKKAEKLVKKAKLRSTLKTIGISVIVTPIVLLLLMYGFRQLSLHNAQKVMDDIRLFNEISSPNVHISNQTYNYHLFGGEIQTRTFKVLGDRPYIWEPLQGQYNLFGKLSREYASYGAIQLERSESLALSNQFERFNEYTGDRVMFFYHPEIDYERYKDSMSELNQLETTTTVELGLSFDQAYSIEEVTLLMPENIDVMWWWVDSYTDQRIDYMKQDQDTISANSMFIYGFHDERFKQYSYGGIDFFINSILRLKESNNFEWEVEQLYEALVGEDRNLESNDVKIIGAVVTGTVDQLDILKEHPFIKASTLGVVFDKK